MNDIRLPQLLGLGGGVYVTDERWRAVEQSLGLELPKSYKQLVDLFGASVWADFLYVFSPFDERLNFERRGKQILEADRESRREFPEHYPIALFPEPGGLLPWAGTDNGDTFYFITAATPDRWPTLIKDSRSPEFEVSFLPPALLVHHIAEGKYRSTILPTL
jgi:hypothetical protein